MGKDQPYVPSTFPIPSGFQDDFRNECSEVDEAPVQCCNFPTREKTFMDNSPIIVFEKVPYIQHKQEGRTTTTNTMDSPQILLRNNQKEEGKQHRIESSTLLNSPLLQPLNTGRDNCIPDLQNRSSSRESVTQANFNFKKHLTVRYSEELEEENKQLKELLNIHHINREQQIEIDANHIIPHISQEIKKVSKSDKIIETKKISGAEAWIRMKEISSRLEKIKKENKEDNVSTIIRSEYVKNGEQVYSSTLRYNKENGDIFEETFNQLHILEPDKLSTNKQDAINSQRENSSTIDNILETSFSSDFSFSSGYRSSPLDDLSGTGSDSIVENKREISKHMILSLIGDIIDSIVPQSVETPTKCSPERHIGLKEEESLLTKEKSKLIRQKETFSLAQTNEFIHKSMFPMLSTEERHADNNIPTSCQIGCKMSPSDTNNKKLKPQDSVDSFLSQNSTGLPDLESIGIIQDRNAGKETSNEIKRIRMVYYGSAGQVMAESSRRSLDDKDCGVWSVWEEQIVNNINEGKIEMMKKVINNRQLLNRGSKETKEYIQSRIPEMKMNKEGNNRIDDVCAETNSADSTDQTYGLVSDDRQGRITDSLSNRNSMEEFKCPSLLTKNEYNSIESEEVSSIDVEGVNAWQKLKEISLWLDRGAHNLL